MSQSEHRWELFKLHSDQSVFDTVDHITGQFGVMNKKRFDELQQSLGWNYAPHGIMSDHALRCAFGPASIAQFDWLHVILQGTYPLEIELAMKSLGGLGFSPAKIHEFLNFDRLTNRLSVFVIVCQLSCSPFALVDNHEQFQLGCMKGLLPMGFQSYLFQTCRRPCLSHKAGVHGFFQQCICCFVITNHCNASMYIMRMPHEERYQLATKMAKLRSLAQ